MNRIQKCGNHEFSIDLPDELFLDGPLIYPCPICKERYSVPYEGAVELCKPEPTFRTFLALHY